MIIVIICYKNRSCIIMGKGSALTTIIITSLLAYIPCFVLYMKSASLLDVPKIFHVSEYLALIVTIFFILALIAYALKFYTLAIVVGLIPLIAEIVAAIMLGILFFFRKDLVTAFVQEKITALVTAPLKVVKDAVALPFDAVTKPLGGLFGK